MNCAEKDIAVMGVRGSLLWFTGNPFVDDPATCYNYVPDGLVLMADGKIRAAGPYSEVVRKYGEPERVDYYADSLIMPGFVDCHTHYVQMPMIGSYGDTLLNWLDNYAFPTEMRFADKTFADDVAERFIRMLLRNGTTTANVFATTYAESVDAFFEASERLGTRMICGKVLQDRNLPAQLADRSAEESVAMSEQLLLKWHGRGRQLYSVMPRFAPTSTPRQLELAGELYQRYKERGVYMHTHLDEVESEIHWVKELYPGIGSYTDVYDHYGLVDSTSVMAHCCIVEESEWQKLHVRGCGVAHCPSSNLFLGDGEFNFREAMRPDRPMRLGIATDVGGGTSFSIIRQMGEAYKVGMLKGFALTSLQAFYMATLGGAEALRLDHRIGRIESGYEADLVVLDLAGDDFTAWRGSFDRSIEETLFTLMTLAPDNLVACTYVAGYKAF